MASLFPHIRAKLEGIILTSPALQRATSAAGRLPPQPGCLRSPPQPGRLRSPPAPGRHAPQRREDHRRLLHGETRPRRHRHPPVERRAMEEAVAGDSAQRKEEKKKAATAAATRMRAEGATPAAGPPPLTSLPAARGGESRRWRLRLAERSEEEGRRPPDLCLPAPAGASSPVPTRRPPCRLAR
ncbi:hypothetical protein DAI22_01g470000 [Oryza sativa Japonica Group]|nr:hypothetical protein DAI22_01g470000 [Oryza sativa Japonica Group]